MIKKFTLGPFLSNEKGEDPDPQFFLDENLHTSVFGEILMVTIDYGDNVMPNAQVRLITSEGEEIETVPGGIQPNTTARFRPRITAKSGEDTSLQLGTDTKPFDHYLNAGQLAVVCENLGPNASVKQVAVIVKV